MSRGIEIQKGKFTNSIFLFEILYEQYYNDFYNYLFRLTKDTNVTEDILHDGFMKIMHKLDTLKNLKKFKSWGFQIMTNTFRDWYRKNKKIILLPNMHTIPDDELQVNSTSFIEEILDYMTLKEKEIFILKQYKKMKYKEIGKIVKCSERTVRRLMKSAITKFVKMAEEKKLIVNGNFSLE